MVLAASVGVMGWWVVRGRSADARQSQVVDLPDAGWSSVRIAVVAALVTVAVVLPLAVANVVARRRSSGPS